MRALIEEKIISRRGGAAVAAASTGGGTIDGAGGAPPALFPLEGAAGRGSAAAAVPFAVPAPPAAPPPSCDKPAPIPVTARRHSDAEPLAKAPVKRAASDPGQQPSLLLADQTFTLAYQPEDGGYFSPDDVFHQVSANSMFIRVYHAPRWIDKAQRSFLF